MKNITFQTDSYSIPFNLTCTVSGLKKVYTSEEYINGKLIRFKGLANLIATYICRDAQKLLKAGKTADEVRAHFNAPTVAISTETAPVVEEKPADNVVLEPTPSLTSHLVTEEAPAVKELPIAKMDKNGKYRTAKGYLISEFNLKNFQIYVAPAIENVA